MLVGQYTCWLVISFTGKYVDTSEALYVYYGGVGWFIGLVAPICILIGSTSVYFVIDTQLSYRIAVGVYQMVTGNYMDPKVVAA